ncbi:hypothetical protein AHF37_02108 [Paragonimus kellicotti]|nr:hypothetical protein AHF37_02108 [Paragonimus kellicotti]
MEDLALESEGSIGINEILTDEQHVLSDPLEQPKLLTDDQLRALIMQSSVTPHLASNWMDAKVESLRARSRLWNIAQLRFSRIMISEAEDDVEQFDSNDEKFQLPEESDADSDMDNEQLLQVEQPLRAIKKISWHRASSAKPKSKSSSVISTPSNPSLHSVGNLAKERNDSTNTRRESTDDDLLDAYFWPDNMPTEAELRHDTVGAAHYVRACIQNETAPIRSVMERLGQKTLVLRHRGLGAAGMKLLTQALQVGIQFQHVFLYANIFVFQAISDNGLRKDGFEQLHLALTRNTSIRTLDLSGNELGDQSCQLISDLITLNRKILNLNLSRNRISSQGAEQLGDAISSNDTMERLNLSWNSITGQGAIMIAHGLKENVRLRQCDLSWNGFAGRAGIEMARVVRENTKLSHLFLRGCRLEDQTLEAIGQGLLVASGDESQLELVDLSRNPFSTKAVSRLFFTLTQLTHTKMKCLLLEDVPIDCQCSQILMELNTKFSDMSIKHGPELIVGNTREEVKVESGKFVSLFVLLREGIRYNRRRLVDILSEMDTERNNYVTLTQFIDALRKLPIRYRHSQLADLLQSLDKLRNGTIYYGDYLSPSPISALMD